MPASFNCTSCAAPLTIYAPGPTMTVSCASCGSMLDAQDPKHQILSQYKSRVTYEPLIPLGKRGKLRGEDFDAIGFMRRRVRYYGVDYEWSEYLLFNPYKGFRWLLEYNGHWTLYTALTEAPKES